jgi:hypothetical protein
MFNGPIEKKEKASVIQGAVDGLVYIHLLDFLYSFDPSLTKKQNHQFFLD